MATTIVYIENGAIVQVGDLPTSEGGIHLSEGWALTEDYYKGSRGWEVMILPPHNGIAPAVECVKHSPSTGKERYRRSFPLRDGAYHLVRTINGAWAYCTPLGRQRWLDRRGIVMVVKNSPNGEFKEADILSTKTNVRRILVATDGEKEEVDFSSGETEHWRKTCPGTSCHEYYTTYRVTGASWTLLTTIRQYGGRSSVLYTNVQDVTVLNIPDLEKVREAARAVEALLDPVQGCLDLAVADAAITDAFPSASLGLRPEKASICMTPWWGGLEVWSAPSWEKEGRLIVSFATRNESTVVQCLQKALDEKGGMTAEEIVCWLKWKGVKIEPRKVWCKTVPDLENNCVRVHVCRHVRDMTTAQLDGNYGRPMWTIQL